MRIHVEVIRRNYCDLVENLDPHYVLDYLYQEGVVDGNDMDEIRCIPVRHDRCRHLLRLLRENAGEKSIFDVFLNALSVNYEFLADSLVETLRYLESENNDENNADEDNEQAKLTKRWRTNVGTLCMDEETPHILPPSSGGLKFRHRSLRILFDNLSTVINKGNFNEFQSQKLVLEASFAVDKDLSCIVIYLNACSYLFQNKLTKCEHAIDQALDVALRTSSPQRYLVEVLSARCWLHLKRNRLDLLEDTLQDAMQIIRQDPITCSGKAAGWIYVDEARRLNPLMNKTDVEKSKQLRTDGITSLETALEHFQRDDSKDGPFGYYFAATKLASLRLACDDYLEIVTTVAPSCEDITASRCLLNEVEHSTIGLPNILKMNFCMSSSDYHYRCGNFIRASEYASDALAISKLLKLDEERGYIQRRVDSLRKVKPLLGEEYDYGMSPHSTPMHTCKHKGNTKEQSSKSSTKNEHSESETGDTPVLNVFTDLIRTVMRMILIVLLVAVCFNMLN